jgi:release factor glutamine methyltransferase
VEWVLKEQGERRKEKGGRVLDIGCGSGAIAIALAKHLPHAEIWAADISPKALDITHQNALNNQVDINLLQFDILNPHPLFTSSPYPLIPSSPHALMPSCPYALIISNPPYIPEGERGSMALHVAGQEPDLALFVPDSDPLIFYRAIAQYAQNHLEPDGEVYVEIHDRFGREVAELFGTFFSKVQLRQDIHGKDRMIRAFNG